MWCRSDSDFNTWTLQYSVMQHPLSQHTVLLLFAFQGLAEVYHTELNNDFMEICEMYYAVTI